MVQVKSTESHSGNADHSSLQEEEEELPPFLSDVAAVEVGGECLRIILLANLHTRTTSKAIISTLEVAITQVPYQGA